jgi:thiol-disulfide isomerase/thioredoxin
MKKSQSLILFNILFAIITLSFTIIAYAEKTSTTPIELNPNLITRGTPASDFTAKDLLTDTTFTFSNLAGKVIILDFFSTSCIPCVHSVPELLKANVKYSSADLEIVSVDVDLNDSEAQIENFANGWEIDWKVVKDSGDLAFYYQLLEIPTFYVIDQDLLVYQAIFGSESAIQMLDSFILELLPSYSSSPDPTITPGGGPIPEFWANNWYWFLLGGVMLIVVIGLMVQRRRVVLHNRKVREQKREAKQRRYRKRER